MGLERLWWLSRDQSSVLLGNKGDFEEGRGWNVDLSPHHRADKGQNHLELMFTEEAVVGQTLTM